MHQYPPRSIDAFTHFYKIGKKDLEILRLAGVGLEQQLPNEIGLLSSLQVLSLGDNALTGA
jgi:hypothetical protein